MQTKKDGNVITATSQEITSQEQLVRVVYNASGTHHKFARGGISVAAVTALYYQEAGMEAERAKLIPIILNVIFCWSILLIFSGWAVRLNNIS